MTINPLGSRPPVEDGPRKVLTPTEKRAVWDRENGLCWWCEQAVDIEEAQWDHRLPRGLLGKLADSIGNFAPLHPACHLTKSRGEDWPRITKAKRQQKLTRPRVKSRRPLQGRGFAKGKRKFITSKKD